MMRMEFRRLDDRLVGCVPCDASREAPAAHRERAKAALMNFYDWGEKSFWARPGNQYDAPEKVVFLNDADAVVAYYTIYDLVADTMLYLTTPPRAH